MITRHFSKIGFWLFALAFAWYLTGNFLLSNVKKDQIAHAKSLHVTEQRADIGSNSRAVIRAIGEDFYINRITLIFDPTTAQASINNQNMQVAVSTQYVDGVFNINLSKVVAPKDHNSSATTEIRLPSSVSKVDTAGISWVEVSGSLPGTTAELALESADCNTRVDIKQVMVSRLKLVANCQLPPKKECCTTVFNLEEQVQINKLEVTMQYGSLDFSGKVPPQQTVLNIGDNVSIKGRREFLQSLRFGNGSR